MSSDSIKRPDFEKVEVPRSEEFDPDAEFGGSERRKKLERKLLWKIDARMSILVLIYILNYVCTSLSFRCHIELSSAHRLTETTQGAFSPHR